MANIWIESNDLTIRLEIEPGNLFTTSFAVAELIDQIEKLRANGAVGDVALHLEKKGED